MFPAYKGRALAALLSTIFAILFTGTTAVKADVFEYYYTPTVNDCNNEGSKFNYFNFLLDNVSNWYMFELNLLYIVHPEHAVTGDCPA